MASEENSAYVQHEAARSAEMVELQAQLKRMLARSRDLSIARLGAQLPDLFDYYEPTEQAHTSSIRRSSRTMARDCCHRDPRVPLKYCRM